MNNIVSELDLLKHAIDTELTLRNAANVEFSRGDKDGPMLRAHSEAILNVLSAAKQLITQAGI